MLLATSGSALAAGPHTAEAATSVPASRSLVPTGLTTNGRTDPLGIPGSAPSFGWAFEQSAQRGVTQSAYQLRVYRHGQAEPAWDSGRVESGEQGNIEYEGPDLESASRYTWQVRAWDGTGRPGPWSESGSFETGLLRASDWGDATWIGREAADPAREWTDYSASVRFTMTGPAFGTFVRARNANNGWMMQLNTTDGTPRLVVHTRVGGSYAVLESIDLTPFGYTVDALRSGEHTLAFTTDGDQITTALNGDVVDRRTDSRFPFGFVGFRTWGGGGEAVTVHEVDVKSTGGQTMLATDFSDGSNPFTSGRVTDQGLVVDGDSDAIVDASRPHPLLREDFATDNGREVAAARVYASSRGLYELTINGQPVGDQHLAPGWTDYRTRIQSQTYDVTNAVREGQNTIGAALAPGWFSGKVGIGWTEQYGTNPSLIARVRVEYTDGTVEWTSTNGDWTSADGPFVRADLQDGETFDSRLMKDGWDEPGFDEQEWSAVEEMPSATELLVPQPDDPIRETEVLTARRHTEPKPGVHVYDLGQNMVGVARLTLTGEPGETVQIRHAEMLNPDGTLYTDNFRTAKVVDRYVFGEAGTITYEPTFTQHGFQYVEITGVDRAPAVEDVNGVVWGSDLPATGNLTTSDDMVNQLMSNISWSQRGNFLSIPTDTPARDERLGWTGDINVFGPTAAYLRDTRAFLSKWMADVRDAQKPNGDLPAVVPSPNDVFAQGGVAWADAAVTVPYSVFHAYGDHRIVRENWDMMVRFMDYVENSAGQDLIDDKRSAFYTTDWLHLDKRNTPLAVMGTAYFAENARMMSEMAEALGEDAEASRYAALSERVRRAFTDRLVAPDGTVDGDTQTGYALAISMNMVTDESKLTGAKNKLADKIAEFDNHLATGFVGTPELLPALSAAGHDDLAFTLLLNDTFPSWGYEIKGGATTIWERWNSKNPDGSFGPVDMNSFNHYAYGAVGEWMFQNLGGISATKPGYATSRIAPDTDNGRITSAAASVQTVHGKVASTWAVRGKTTHLTVEVPVNTTAEVVIPVPEGFTVRESGRPIDTAPGVSSSASDGSTHRVEVGSGLYRFTVVPG
ncbi:MAG: glycoside hydrolase family 78 protein [Actinomycetota bacterium]|nr:glycoside hydrolase family 78 protein [Actinomycetota bacterium]